MLTFSSNCYRVLIGDSSQNSCFAPSFCAMEPSIPNLFVACHGAVWVAEIKKFAQQLGTIT